MPRKIMQYNRQCFDVRCQYLIRTSVRIITGVTLTMALLLVLLNRTYLRPFDSAVGQSVLLLVFACFGTALWWLASMSRYAEPERFLARPTGDAGWS
jgi:hypothetical protein